MLRLTLCAFLLAVAPALYARGYWAEMTGAEEVPPNASTATGQLALAVLDDGRIAVSYRYQDIPTTVTGGHIHRAAAGDNGPIVIDLTPPAAGDAEILVRTFAPSAAQLEDLRDELWYVNIHSTAFPGGEIRGQILPSLTFQLRLEGAQEVPPVASPGFGVGHLVLAPDLERFWVQVLFEDLDSALTAGHIHGPAPRGTNAGILVDLTPGTGVTQGDLRRFVAAGALDLGQLSNGLWYVNLHTTVFPGGEVRGQLDVIHEHGFETPHCFAALGCPR